MSSARLRLSAVIRSTTGAGARAGWAFRGPMVEKTLSIEDRIAAMSPDEKRARLRSLAERAMEALGVDACDATIGAEIEEIAGDQGR